MRIIHIIKIMKKLLFLMSVVAFLFASCEGPPGRDGLNGGETYWFVRDYPISANNWQLVGGVDQLNSYYRASINISELGRDIYENGNVFCYMYQTVNGRGVQTILPFTVPKANDDGELWTETYSYDFYPGTITFYFICDDFYTNNRPPATTFRVVLNY